MAIRIEAQNLVNLTDEAFAMAVNITDSLRVVRNSIEGNGSPEKLAANYRALSQIFDDLVRLADSTDQIEVSLSQTEEIVP